MPKVATIPPFDAFMNPIIQALKALGGSGTIEEINAKVVEIVGLTDDQLEIIHDPERGSQTEVEYRLAWARTYLKKYEVIDNSSRGVWALTPKGNQLDHVNPQAVKRFMNEQRKKAEPALAKDDIDTTDDKLSWREELMNVLLKMDPPAFERLIQRLLRESGFIQVEVTGRSGDGGIDGKGIMRLGGLLSFHVIFQCKRYRGSVSANQVRDFRGAMVGRSDKGLFHAILLVVTLRRGIQGVLRRAPRSLVCFPVRLALYPVGRTTGHHCQAGQAPGRYIFRQVALP
jgi:restriction system protein